MTATSDLTTALQTLAADEFKALVTVEITERLAAKATEAIESGDPDEAKRLLAALADHTVERKAAADPAPQVYYAICDQAGAAVDRVLAQRP